VGSSLRLDGQKGGKDRHPGLVFMLREFISRKSDRIVVIHCSTEQADQFAGGR
jgi:hypothetical protein